MGEKRSMNKSDRFRSHAPATKTLDAFLDKL